MLQLLLFTAGSEPGLNFCFSAFSLHLNGSHKSDSSFPGNILSPGPSSPPPNSPLLARRESPVLPVTADAPVGLFCFSDWFRASAVESGASPRLPARDHGAFSGSFLCFLDTESTRAGRVPRLRFMPKGHAARCPATCSGTEDKSSRGC